MTDQALLATITGEAFQPVRLYYRVVDREAVLRAFRKLRCVDYDATQKRWVWLYQHEASSLRFKRSYADLPKQLRPIVLGSFFLRGADTLILDVRSPERALAALRFFDKHLPRKAAQVTEAEIVNKLFPLAGNEHLAPAQLFDHQESARRDPEALPDIDRLPIRFYEDGIDQFALAVKVRQIVASEHWLGNTKCSLLDAIKMVTSTP
jgi:hypothetical protein